MSRTHKIMIAAVVVWTVAALALFGQGTSSETDLENLPLKKIEPIFPDENKYLIFMEGEDSVSTNFNKEPTQNYSCSGSRTLQLSRTTALQGGASFYADFVFYVEDDGTYELWYGGTPPGPRSDLYPSFSSPFQYSIDDHTRVKDVYREDMEVAENYAPSYYWNFVKEERLSSGRHQLRVYVREKRDFDSRFYFYIDCIFFVKKEGATRLLGNKLPKIFPKNFDNRRMNEPFKPIDDYLIAIRDNPQNTTPLIEVSLIYSLVSDYLNAIKNLKRALVLAPDDIRIKLLLAKNYIWMQEISIGLDMYMEILKKDPSRLDIWMEAGKVAGWTGRFKESIDFFTRGLKTYPDSLDLLVNMGLSHLWSGKADDADRAIQQAKDKAGRDPEKIKALARVFLVNGYPEKAIDIYRQGIENTPADLELYLLLEDTYLNLGRKKDGETVRNLISKRFISSDKLSRYLDLYHEKIGLKDKVLDVYRAQLASEPDNLELREMLAQTYFWNGLRDEAIAEYLNILANNAFRELKEMEQVSSTVFEHVDKFHLYLGYFNRIEKQAAEKKTEIEKQTGKYSTALADYERLKKQGKDSTDTASKLEHESSLLASLVADGKKMTEQYDRVSKAFAKESLVAVDVAKKTADEEENLEKVMKSIAWEWNKSQTIAELDEVAKNGLVLADHVLARIAQIDRNLPVAKTRFEKATASKTSPETTFAYYEYLLWSGNGDEAAKYLATNRRLIQAYMPHMESVGRLSGLTRELFSGSEAEAGSVPEADGTLVMNSLSTMTKDTSTFRNQADEIIRKLQSVLVKKLSSTFYKFQENTYLLRNELGDFYLRKNEHDKAITQYRQVLAIDPYNVSAIYRLGTVYQWKRDWYEAMAAFDKVYQSDPNYENVATLYNQLARQYADEVKIDANAFTDTSRIRLQSKARYQRYINSSLRLAIDYALDSMNYYRTWATPTDPQPFFYSYNVHNIGIGVQLDLYSIGLKIMPVGGINLFLKDDFYKEELSIPDPPYPTNPDLRYADYTFWDYLAYLGIDFFGQVEYSLDLGSIFSSYGTFGFRRYPDSFAYHIEDVYELWAEPSFVFRLSFIDLYPFKDWYIRLATPVDILFDENIIFKPSIECSLPFFSIDNPSTVFSVLLTPSFENTFYNGDATVTQYYKPDRVLQLLGQLGISFKFGPKDMLNIPGFTIKFGGGPYTEHTFLDTQIDRFKLIGDAMFEIKGDKADFSVGFDFNLTFNNDWSAIDYWSTNVKVMYTSKLQNLRAQ